MEKLHIIKKLHGKFLAPYLALFVLLSVFAFFGCTQREPEVDPFANIPEITLDDDTQDAGEDLNSICIINDLRTDNVSMAGRYVSPFNPEAFFEITDDQLELSASMGKYEEEAEVDYFEGLTWICCKNNPEAGNGPLYLYSSDLQTFYKEAPYSDLVDGVEGYETLTFEREGPAVTAEEATENEKGLLYFTPESFFLGVTFSEIEAAYPDLEYRGVMASGSYYYSPEAEISFIFDISLGSSGNDKNAETIAFSVTAKQIFPNMGTRVLKWEIEKIIGEKLVVSRYAGGSPEVYFHYHGYKFQYQNQDTYDILPDTIMVISAYNED